MKVHYIRNVPGRNQGCVLPDAQFTDATYESNRTLALQRLSVDPHIFSTEPFGSSSVRRSPTRTSHVLPLASKNKFRTSSLLNLHFIICPITIYFVGIRKMAAGNGGLENLLMDVFSGGLETSLWDGFSGGLENSVMDVFSGGLETSLWHGISSGLENSLWEVFGDGLRNSLWDVFSGGLENSVMDVFSGGLKNSLWDGFSSGLENSLWEVFSDGLRNSL